MGTAIDTRYAFRETCDAGHPQFFFDIIKGGKVYEAACKLHLSVDAEVGDDARLGFGQFGIRPTYEGLFSEEEVDAVLKSVAEAVGKLLMDTWGQ